MAIAMNQEEGRWWRFSEYKIENNRIMPAPGARLSQYDPWANYRASRSRGGIGAPPYQSLLSLLQTLSFRHCSHGLALSSKSETELCKWCSAHGLLGTMLQDYDAIHLPAVISRPRSSDPGGDFLMFNIRLSGHMRGADGWHTVTIDHQPPMAREARRLLFRRLDDCPVNESGYAETAIPYSELAESVDIPRSWWWREPAAHEVSSGIWRTLSQLAEWYFPGVPIEERETHAYPLPLTPAFWWQYAEPVADFLLKANWLQMAIEYIAASDGRDKRDFEVGKEILDTLTSSANRVLRSSDGRLRLVWVFPSLLASYAMMLAQDITEERTVHICKACETPFLSSAYQAKFCSDTCRHRYQKREQRKRKGAQP